MIILGIDPGTSAVGYAALKVGPKPELIEYGLLKISSKDQIGRLQEIHSDIKRLIKKTHASVCSVERLFFTKNAKTAISVSEARGVILLTTALAGLAVYEYTPLEVKKTVTGDGRADKLQVQKIIRISFPDVRELQARDDVFDAIAVAYTCFLKERHNLNLF